MSISTKKVYVYRGLKGNTGTPGVDGADGSPDTANQVAEKLGAADNATHLGAARTALAVETTTQLNARDTANRDRANHTGTQPSAASG